ncbi:helix-turn-helix transcriptional regulator [Pseudomonas sp.]|jgi:DNA-binding XRE family transcriptional regulator|uniref:helix-turn-helix domain-containing protein n=1 Tax=Pseudomonas sp. TaxID=306 RepID=UPI002EDAC7D6
MSAPTHNIQIINGPDGKPAFVVIPYEDYVGEHGVDDLIPHEVVSRMVDGLTPIRAWREYLDLTQEHVAARLGISQPAYAQQESVARPRKQTRERIAQAFGIRPDQLDI